MCVGLSAEMKCVCAYMVYINKALEFVKFKIKVKNDKQSIFPSLHICQVMLCFECEND